MMRARQSLRQRRLMLPRSAARREYTPPAIPPATRLVDGARQRQARTLTPRYRAAYIV